MISLLLCHITNLFDFFRCIRYNFLDETVVTPISSNHKQNIQVNHHKLLFLGNRSLEDVALKLNEDGYYLQLHDRRPLNLPPLSPAAPISSSSPPVVEPFVVVDPKGLGCHTVTFFFIYTSPLPSFFFWSELNLYQQ